MAVPATFGWQRLALSVAVDGGNSGDINVSGFTGVTVIARLTALTGGAAPTVQFFLDYKLPDGTYVQTGQGASLSAASVSISTGNTFFSIGPGMTIPQVSGVNIRIRWVVTGGPATAVADLFVLGESDY